MTTTPLEHRPHIGEVVTEVTTVLHVGNLHWASEAAVVESVLGRLRGVEQVDANPVAQTASITFDPRTTSVAELRRWVLDCGYHCSGQSVPSHVCPPMQEPGHEGDHGSGHGSDPGTPPTADAHEAGHGDPAPAASPHDAMGHGGHAGASMAGMATDMRRRFLVALVFSVPILLWSPLGRDVLNFSAAAPFGLRDDVFQLILSVPVVFWSAWIFFSGAARALRARTLDMMVLVAVAVGTGWIYSLVVTLTGGGEVFYEAAAMLSVFVLLGHWFEMRARGGANEAIRALLGLAPAKAVVLRDGQEVEVPTAEVVVGDLLLIRPGAKVAVDGTVEDGESELDKGEPEVTDVISEGIDETEMLGLVAAVERESEHPLARAIVVAAKDRGVPELRAESFDSVPGHGATATVVGRRVAVGNNRLMTRDKVDLGPLTAKQQELAENGRTAVIVAVDGRAVGLVALADAPRETAAAAVAALRNLDVEVVMLTGDNQATADRIAGILGVETVIAEVLPGDKAAKVAELQAQGRKVAMVGDGVNDAPALAQADIGIAIGAGTDVAIETADLVLKRSDPLDVPVALRIGRGTLRKMRQNLGWAIGYNAIALPIAAGVFVPAFGLVLRPEIAALSMSGSSFIVAVNALWLKRLHLPTADTTDSTVAPAASTPVPTAR